MQIVVVMVFLASALFGQQSTTEIYAKAKLAVKESGAVVSILDQRPNSDTQAVILPENLRNVESTVHDLLALKGTSLEATTPDGDTARLYLKAMSLADGSGLRIEHKILALEVNTDNMLSAGKNKALVKGGESGFVIREAGVATFVADSRVASDMFVNWIGKVQEAGFVSPEEPFSPYKRPLNPSEKPWGKGRIRFYKILTGEPDEPRTFSAVLNAPTPTPQVPGNLRFQ